MTKIKKVLLTLPNNNWTGARTQWTNYPLTLAVLTSVIKDKYEVKILDSAFYNMTEKQVTREIKKYKPDVAGISCISYENDRDIRKMTSVIKAADPKIIIIAGGIYPTLLPEKIMENKDIDFSIIGEGEYRFPKLLEMIVNNESFEKFDGLAYRVGKKLFINPVREYIHNLDALPFPCYDYLDFNAYSNAKIKKNSTMLPRRFPYAQICATRGCPFNCVFCSTKLVNGPRIRGRSAESVLKEVDWLYEKYKVKEIIFVDDNLFINRARFKKILEGFIERREKRGYDLEWKMTDGQIIALDDEILEMMKRSGCYELNISVEAGDEETLKLMNKPKGTVAKSKAVLDKAKELGMYRVSSFIIGLPGETWEQIRQTAKFAEELDLDYCTFNIATPLPRTQLYTIAKERNLLRKDFSFYDSRGYGQPSITTNEFTPGELLMFRVMEWDRINFSTPEKIAKIAERSGMTIEEIEEWRISTRRGVKVELKRLNEK